MSTFRKPILACALLATFLPAIPPAAAEPGANGEAVSQAAPPKKNTKRVVIPGSDRFVPFVLTVHVGDTVQWVNQDTDDHTVVSDDAFNTVGAKLSGIDQVVAGTDSNGGDPGTYSLKFKRAGTFVYYCRFHATLDDDHQPIAPGPQGGVQDDATGNYGTPMMGVIVVVPHKSASSGK
jgi:plastocyanin